MMKKLITKTTIIIFTLQVILIINHQHNIKVIIHQEMLKVF